MSTLFKRRRSSDLPRNESFDLLVSHPDSSILGFHIVLLLFTYTSRQSLSILYMLDSKDSELTSNLHSQT
jgi:hypothetical protein